MHLKLLAYYLTFKTSRGLTRAVAIDVAMVELIKITWLNEILLELPLSFGSDVSEASWESCWAVDDRFSYFNFLLFLLILFY